MTQLIQNIVAFVSYRISSSGDSPTKPNLPPIDDDFSKKSLAPTPTYRWRYFITNLLSLLVSAACIGTAAVLLHKHQDDVLPLWRESVTINSVIAWLSALAKLTLVIPLAECIGQAKWRLFGQGRRKLNDLELADAAGRDALGALAWMLHFRGGVLVHLGAALVVVSLGFDPAMQQLVRYDLAAVVEAGGAAGLAVNRDYSPVRGLDRGLLFTTPKAVLDGAYSAVLGDGIRPAYECSSGNCTFPAVATVGVCSACTNVTGTLIRDCEDLSPRKPFCVNEGVCYTSGQMCTYRHRATNATVGGREGVFLDIAATGADFQNAGSATISISKDLVNLTALFIDPDGAPDPPDNATIADTRLPIAPGHVRDGVHKARAYTCTLSYCAQRIQASVVAGDLKEAAEVSGGSLDKLTIPAPSLSEITDELFQSKVNLTSSTSKDLVQLSLAAMFALSQGMSTFLTGNSTLPDPTTPKIYMSEFHRAMYESLLSVEFPDMIRGMTESMTAAIRNDGVPAEGEAWVNRMLLRVEWSWITLPVGLWSGALLLLLVVTFQAWRGHAPWLGTSQLAAVYIDLEREVRVDVDGRDASWGDRGSMMKVGETHKLRVAPAHGASNFSARLEFTRLTAPR